MLASILIIVFSLVLLVYWFRYSCLLIVRNHGPVAKVDGRFKIAEVQERLRTGEALDPLHLSLERDYKVLSYLLRHAAALELDSFEDKLLVIDYAIMRCWYRITRIAAPDQARHALSEMASVLEILAGKIGERAGAEA
jgi:hypothetical protein